MGSEVGFWGWVEVEVEVEGLRVVKGSFDSFMVFFNVDWLGLLS